MDNNSFTDSLKGAHDSCLLSYPKSWDTAAYKNETLFSESCHKT